MTYRYAKFFELLAQQDLINNAGVDSFTRGDNMGENLMGYFKETYGSPAAFTTKELARIKRGLNKLSRKPLLAEALKYITGSKALEDDKKELGSKLAAARNETRSVRELGEAKLAGALAAIKAMRPEGPSND